jgi:small subunit ribosomal protein S11
VVLFIFNRHLITIVTITNLTGDTISWASAVQGSKDRKVLLLLLKQRAEKAALEALSTGMKNVEILVKDKVQDEKAIRAIEGAGDIISIQDITSVPHNGCRPPKRRV